MILFKIKRCDNCGKLNPPVFDNNPVLCKACATPNGSQKRNGFYQGIGVDKGMGTDGKIGFYTLQLPFAFYKRSWWKLV